MLPLVYDFCAWPSSCTSYTQQTSGLEGGCTNSYITYPTAPYYRRSRTGSSRPLVPRHPLSPLAHSGRRRLYHNERRRSASSTLSVRMHALTSPSLHQFFLLQRIRAPCRSGHAPASSNTPRTHKLFCYLFTPPVCLRMLVAWLG